MNTCPWCDELILENDVRSPVQPPTHYACGIRMVAGSLAHILRRCSCFVPGSDESDPPELTRRQAAEIAADAFLGCLPRSARSSWRITPPGFEDQTTES